jgi:hypothetical protein
VLPSDRRTDGRWRLGGARGRTTHVGPRVAARWYGDAEREASSACARSWEGAAWEGASSGGARGHQGNGAGAVRRGSNVSDWQRLIEIFSKILNRSAQSGK